LNTTRAMLLDAPSWDFDPLCRELTDLKKIRDGEAPHLEAFTLSKKTRVRQCIISLLRKAGEKDIISKWDLQRSIRSRDQLINQLTQENARLKELEATRQARATNAQAKP